MNTKANVSSAISRVNINAQSKYIFFKQSEYDLHYN